MSLSNKWIITDRVSPLAKEGLEALGKQVDWMPDISNEDLQEIISSYEGIIISSKTNINAALIDRATQLKVVGRVGSGMEHVDVDYCQSKNIICLNSPEGNCNAVAEHAFGMLLCLANNIRISNAQLAQGVWEREGNRGFEIKGMNIGIIGYGHTGRSFAEKFKGWEVDVLAYDKYKDGFSSGSVEEVTYEALLERSDVISFHIPYNQETHHWINDEFIEQCKKGVILINTSRGAIADSLALKRGLESHRIGGLCLDVFEDEPITNSKKHKTELYAELLAFDNVIATPHVAGWSRESKVLLVQTLISKIDKVLVKQGAQ